MTRFYGSPPAPVGGSGRLTFDDITTVTSGSLVYGFPTICRMSGGDLLLAYNKIPGGDTIGTNATIVGKISSDDGDTWGSEFTLASDGSNSCLNCALITLASGRVMLMYNLFNGTVTPADAIRIRYSDDNGSTWSSAYTVNSTFTGATGPGATRPIQFANDHVMIGFHGKNIADAHNSAHAMFSTDDGATFGSEVTIANGVTDGREYLEPSFALIGTDLITNLRTSTGATGTIYTNASSDSGATWGATASAFSGASGTNLYRRPSNGTLIACVRQNTTEDFDVQTSIDDGVTWVDQGLAESSGDLFYYGCAIDKLDGNILLVYSLHTAANTAGIYQLTATEA